MLENTFIHLPDFGPARERTLWQSGVKTWDDFLERFDGSARHSELSGLVAASAFALEIGDADYFARNIHRSETWRSFSHFKKIAYLDIETTGFGRNQDYVTVIGVFDGKSTKSYIHGKNMDEFSSDIEKFDSLVTFNGSLFDAPFIKKAFPEVNLPQLHVDLRFVLSSLGIKGGLKKIEARFGFEREDDLKGLNGYDAVKLWKKYRNENNKGALDRLVRYNAADIENLEKLMEWAYVEKRKETKFDEF